MKIDSRFYLFVLLFSTILAFGQCKKDEPDDTTPVDELAFTDAEKALIYNNSSDSAMYVMNYFIHSDSLILRKQSIDVNFNDTSTLNKLIDRMKVTVLAEDGVGIAAPQVGINRNIIWVQRRDKTGMPFECYLNPKIILYSNKAISFVGDGCLSIPGINGTSHRYSAVVVEYDRPDGTHNTELIEGYSGSNFTAVIFQHEIDHLNGMVFLDRL